MTDAKKEFLTGLIAVVVMLVVLFLAVWKFTSAECWYAGMHDSKCEYALYMGKKKCHCYERLVAADKNR